MIKPKRIGPDVTLFENAWQRLFRVDMQFEHGTRQYFVTDYGARPPVYDTTQQVTVP